MPHSEISGSMSVSNSPEHIVGNHVLRRLCVPRYPPLALSSLTTLVLITVLYFHEDIHVCFNCLLFSRYLCSFQGSGWNFFQQSELYSNSGAEFIHDLLSENNWIVKCNTFYFTSSPNHLRSGSNFTFVLFHKISYWRLADSNR